MIPVRAPIFLAAALAAAPLAAQTALPVPPPGDDVLSLRTGDRVRVWSTEAAPLSAALGTVNAADGDGLALVIDKRVRVVHFTALKKLEVRRVHRHTGTGALVGAMMGAFLGWKLVLLAILLGVLAGGAVAIALLTTGSKGRKDPVPFGPFLALGAVLSLLWGNDLLGWYLGRFFD